MAPLKPFQLLEINIISAQDLEPVSKKMRTYATAWMHSNRKLSSCVDTDGKNNPTWNDKFVFRVDEEFLRQDTSAVMIEIYAVHWLRDVLVGTVRVLVGNLIPPPGRSHVPHGQHYSGMRFVALQVRRPSGRPQGILNIGVALLGSSMRSMPLYRQLSMSAVGFRDLMDDPMSFQHIQQNENLNNHNNNNNSQVSTMKPILRRTKSERSEVMDLNRYSPNSSLAAVKSKNIDCKESSILSITDGVNPFHSIRKVGKASSVISGAELREKPKINKGKKGKGGSVLSDSILSKESSSFRKIQESNSRDSKNEGINKKDNGEKGNNDHEFHDKTAVVNEKPVTNIKSSPKDKLPLATIRKPAPKYNSNNYVIGAPVKKGNSLWSDSEVGPSPSEVAAVMAERRYPLDDNQGSVLDGWSVDESVEGLRSKLERWRMELPPLYDRGGFSSSSYKSSATGGRHGRRHSDGSSGLFSCFGNIFGYECQCICGKPAGRRSRSARFHSPSTLTPGRSFI